jgi:hypothetical protein
MGEQYDERREIADARERMSELAVELARRASPEHLKAEAKIYAGEKRTELKQLAKEAVMRKTTEWREVATSSPKGIGILGAIAGGVIGSIIAKRFAASRSGPMLERHELWDGRDEPSTYVASGRYETTGDELPAMGASDSGGGGMGDKLQSAKHAVMDKAGSVMEKAGSAMDSLRGTASDVRDRIPSPGDVRQRASRWYDQGINDQPLFFALGALALGMVASAVIPVSARERQMIEPAKRKVRETVSQVGEQLQQKVESIGAEDQHASAELHEDLLATSDSGSIPGQSAVPQFPPLDDLTTRH